MVCNLLSRVLKIIGERVDDQGFTTVDASNQIVHISYMGGTENGDFRVEIGVSGIPSPGKLVFPNKAN